MLLKNSIVAVIACAAVACVSSGTKVTQTQLSDFHVGATTEGQVLAELGPPTTTSTFTDGSKMDIYAHTAAHANAASYVPVVGLFAGGAKGSTQSVTLNFDSQGILRSTSSSNTQVNVNTGLANQQ